MSRKQCRLYDQTSLCGYCSVSFLGCAIQCNINPEPKTDARDHSTADVRFECLSLSPRITTTQ